MSMVFSVYYMVYANEADEKLRKYRAFCTVEMMRTTWEKTTNPYIRAVTWFHRPSLPIARPLLIPRPEVGAHHTRPSKAWLFYAKSERQLRMEEELVLDFCGGGYICMDPRHHEERLRQLAKQMQKPVLCVDYCKAPEYPYPFALEECFDLYRTLHETAGKVIGMSGSTNFRVILTGDSAGGNLATGVALKVIQYPQARIQLAYQSLTSRGSKDARSPPPLPKPIGMVLSYPSLNFGFSSWMKPEHLRLLRQQSEVNLDNLAQHQTDLSYANGNASNGNGNAAGGGSSTSVNSLRSARRRSAANLTNSTADRKRAEAKRARSKERKDPRSYQSLTRTAELHLDERARYAEVDPTSDENGESSSPPDPYAATYDKIWAENALTPSWEKGGLPWGQVAHQAVLDEIADRQEKRAQAAFEREQKVLQQAAEAADIRNKDQKRAPFNTRLTVTSMAGYFQDRIITQGMLRAMAILYIGPKRQPDLDHDYFLSPVVAPAHLLAEFPPVLFICGEKDPLCDDTVIMAGRIREAKLAKKADLERRRAMASARFGEGLRTTPISGAAAARIPVDPIENETAEDWVQMRIIEGWSHGFLQMSSLMPEAKQVIGFLGTWMSIVFEEYRDKLDEERERREAERVKKALENSPVLGEGSSFGLGMQERTTGGNNGGVGASGVGGRGKGKDEVVAAEVKVQQQQELHDADDEGEGGAGRDTQANEEDEAEEEDDGPIMVIPKKTRASHPAAGTTLSSQQQTPVAPSQVANLRSADSNTRSYSDTETTASTSTSFPRTASVGRAESETNLLPLDAATRSGYPGSMTSRVASGLSPTPSGGRGSEYERSMLMVEEAKLLARRRDDVLFGLEGNVSAVYGSEDEDEEGRGKCRSGGEGSTTDSSRMTRTNDKAAEGEGREKVASVA